MLGSALAIGALALLLVAVTIAAPPGRDGLVLLALAAGAGLPRRPAAPAVVATCLVASLIQVAHGQAPTTVLCTVVNDGVTGYAGIGGRLLIETNEHLRSAREEIARLAVAEERLRFARDLHDLIGQNLTLVALKTEVVSKALPADVPGELRDQVDEVAAMTRRSLDDVRSLVAGYRQPGIMAELVDAGAALGEAGIALSVEDSPGRFPTRSRQCSPGRSGRLRRTSSGTATPPTATCASGRDGSAVLELEDDGRGAASGKPGTELRRIAERAAALGGTFEASRAAEGRRGPGLPADGFAAALAAMSAS